MGRCTSTQTLTVGVYGSLTLVDVEAVVEVVFLMLVSAGRKKGPTFSEGGGHLHRTLHASCNYYYFMAVKAGERLQCRGAKGCVPVPRSHTAGQRTSSKDAVTWKPLCLSAAEVGLLSLQGVQLLLELAARW